jgi:hypothetical protein
LSTAWWWRYSFTLVRLQTKELLIALMMEAVRTSETSLNFNVTTRRYIPDDSKLQTRRRENLESHKSVAQFKYGDTL